jgi:hypothetical protein
MLLLQKKLEQKQIEKLAMVKMKEARTTLYKLFEKKYICLQEIARNAERKNSYRHDHSTRPHIELPGTISTMRRMHL